jgi:hypothetical protein
VSPLVEMIETLRGMMEVLVSDCGVEPCEGSMAPAEDLCGKAMRLLALVDPK